MTTVIIKLECCQKYINLPIEEKLEKTTEIKKKKEIPIEKEKKGNQKFSLFLI